jgi:hypothetical protein
VLSPTFIRSILHTRCAVAPGFCSTNKKARRMADGLCVEHSLLFQDSSLRQVTRHTSVDKAAA